MRSKNTRIINVSKIRQHGDLPGFIPLIHRHFQKALPQVASDQEAFVNAPTDLLDMILPVALLSSIESVEIHYKKRT